MRLSDDSHDYHCTICGTTGGPCLQALSVSQRIAGGLAENEDRLPETFELVSQTVFNGCGRNCAVNLHVNGTTVSIDCGCDGATVTAHRHRTSARAASA